MADNEIQLDLLGDKTLEEVFQFVKAKEAGEWSVGLLQLTEGAEAVHSQYLKTKQDEVKRNMGRADPQKSKHELWPA